MATAFKLLDRPLPSPPRPAVRVVFDAAAQAVDNHVATLPAVVRDATLDELAVAEMVHDTIRIARRDLSPIMFDAFLSWGEKTALAWTEGPEGDAEIGERCNAANLSAKVVLDTPVSTAGDSAVKLYVAAAVASQRASDLGPIIFAPEYDWEDDAGEPLPEQIVADLIAGSELARGLNELADRAWRLTPACIMFAPEVGAVLTRAFGNSRDDLSFAELMAMHDAAMLQFERSDATDKPINSPAYLAEEERMCSAWRRALRATPRNWSEFVQLLGVMTENGRDTLPHNEAAADLFAHAQRLIGREKDADAELLAAFDHLRREAADYVVSGGSDDPADEETFRCERVLQNTPAHTIEGVVAKLRQMYQLERGGADSRADLIMADPTGPEFQALIADKSTPLDLLWPIIEDLARIGGVNLTGGVR